VQNHKKLNKIAKSFIGQNDVESVSRFQQFLIQHDEAGAERSERAEDNERDRPGPTVETQQQQDDIPLLLSSSEPSFKWNKIERVSASTLSPEAFERNYVNKGVPVVIENAELANVLQSVITRELILDLCGDKLADLGSRVVRPIRSMAKVINSTHPRLLREFSERLKMTRGLTLNETLDFLEGKGKIKTLRDFFDSEFMGESKIARQEGVDFYNPVDNLWPPSVHSWHIIDRCPAFAERVKAAVEQKLHGDWSYLSKILFHERPTEFKKFMLFASGDGVRAYHAHHHAKAAHVMVLVLQGAKRAVVWDRGDEKYLYPFSTRVGGKKMYNPIYLANAFDVNFDKQPDVARSRGFGAVVKAGDILFMPCGWIHSFENVGETIQLVWSPTIKYHLGEQSVVPILDDGEAEYCPNQNGRDGYLHVASRSRSRSGHDS
jgi:dTDP-4-dehydrorhamnose 3,5-epimerase-like enzyme